MLDLENLQVKINGREIPLEVRQSSRAKRVSIKYRKGSFTVVIPEEREIDPEDIIRENSGWIERKLPEARRYSEKVPDRELSEGGEISVLGRYREIKVGKRRTGEVSGDSILLAEHLVERNSLESEVEKTLRKHAGEKFREKASELSREIRGDYGRITVRDQETRWGSCSGKDNLNFNWRLVLGPEHVLEYVVVHELVHLEIRNHSEKFWKRVEQIMPDYRRSKDWLDENSARLEWNISS